MSHPKKLAQFITEVAAVLAEHIILLGMWCRRHIHRCLSKHCQLDHVNHFQGSRPGQRLAISAISICTSKGEKSVKPM